MTKNEFNDIVENNLFEVVIRNFNEEYILRGHLYASKEKIEEMDKGEKGVVYYFDEQLGDTNFPLSNLIEVKIIHQNLEEIHPDTEVKTGYVYKQFYQYTLDKSVVVGCGQRLLDELFYEWEDINLYNVLDVTEKKMKRYLLYPKTDIRKRLEKEGILIDLSGTDTVDSFVLFRHDLSRVNIKKLIFGHIFIDQSFQHHEEKDIILKLLDLKEETPQLSYEDLDLKSFDPQHLPLIYTIDFRYNLTKDEYNRLFKLILTEYLDEFYDYLNPFFNFKFIDKYDIDLYLKRQIKENNFNFINLMATKSFGNQQIYEQPIAEIKRRFSDYSDFRKYLCQQENEPIPDE